MGKKQNSKNNIEYATKKIGTNIKLKINHQQALVPTETISIQESNNTEEENGNNEEVIVENASEEIVE